MGRSTRRTARRRTKPASRRSTPPQTLDQGDRHPPDKDQPTADSAELHDDATPPRVWFRRSGHSPVPSTYLAFAGVLTVPIVGMIAGKYVVCPGQATGTARTVLSA